VQGTNYRPQSFLLCLAYYAIIFVLIAPGFYIKPKVKEAVVFILIFIAFSIINFKYKLVLSLPIGFFITEIFTRSFLDIAEVLFGAGLLVMGIYFLFNLLRQLHRTNYQRELTFFAASIVLIAISCVKITWGFSSRYPAQVIPLLVILCAYFYKRDSRNVYRVAIGVMLGLVSYASYMMFNQA
jgi:membrane-bound ClpP family serine protease